MRGMPDMLHVHTVCGLGARPQALMITSCLHLLQISHALLIGEHHVSKNERTNAYDLT